jgi:hypothetical protein
MLKLQIKPVHSRNKKPAPSGASRNQRIRAIIKTAPIHRAA